MGADSRALLDLSFRPLTRRSYMSRWCAFATNCRDRHLHALVAHAATIFRFVAFEHSRGALAPKSSVKYLSTIRIVYAMARHPDPTATKVVSLAVAGHKKAHAVEVDGQDRKRLPIAADFIKRVVLVGVYTKDDEIARRCGGLVWPYVLFNRPGAAADMRFKHFRVTAAGIECQVPSFQGGVRQGAECIAIVVPFSVTNARGGEDVINLLESLLKEHTFVGRRPDEHLFAPGHLPADERARDLGAGATSIWLAELLTRLDVSPPLGVAYSGHSLRSGAASAAYSLGFPVEVVGDLGTHKSTATTLRLHIGGTCCVPVLFYLAGNDLPSEPHGNDFPVGGGGDDAAVAPSDGDAQQRPPRWRSRRLHTATLAAAVTPRHLQEGGPSAVHDRSARDARREAAVTACHRHVAPPPRRQAS